MLLIYVQWQWMRIPAYSYYVELSRTLSGRGYLDFISRAWRSGHAQSAASRGPETYTLFLAIDQTRIVVRVKCFELHQTSTLEASKILCLCACYLSLDSLLFYTLCQSKGYSNRDSLLVYRFSPQFITNRYISR